MEIEIKKNLGIVLGPVLKKHITFCYSYDNLLMVGVRLDN
jgi:hypothetical protein